MASVLAQIQKEYAEGSSEFHKHVERLEIKNGTVLLRPGQFNRRGFVVEEGCLRSYILDGNGREHTIQFAPEEWIIGDMEAATTGEPSSLYIEAIEHSVVYFVTEHAMDGLVKASWESMVQSRQMLINRIVAIQRRLVLQLTADAESRYIEFVKTYPQLAHRVPLKYIASYLGITPESLSRVRKQMAMKAH